MGEYCAIHKPKIAKGGGNSACTVCGKGVKNKFLVCSGCGYHKVFLRVWGKGYRDYEAEVRRLKNIEI